MTVQEAMLLIDERVRQGARVTVTQTRPSTFAGRDFPISWTARLHPVCIDGIPAHPSCTAYSYEGAVVGIGEFLAGLRRSA